MPAFFDSNVFVYAFGVDEGGKRARALDVIERHTHDRSLVISTQVLMETWDVLVRKQRRDPVEVHALLRLLTAHVVVTPGPAAALASMERAQRDRLRSWDALIVQAALEGCCDTLYSEDFQAGRRFGALVVVNPFDTTAHEPPAAYAPAPRKRARRAAPRA